jgi:hypothetical protein
MAASCHSKRGNKIGQFNLSIQKVPHIRSLAPSTIKSEIHFVCE